MENDPIFQRIVDKAVKQRVEQELKEKGKSKKLKEKQQNQNSNRIVKSPSDTTVYAPALLRNSDLAQNDTYRFNNIQNEIDRISNFVEQMRIDSVKKTPEPKQPQDPVNQARGIADRMILDAEQFRAQVEKPSGTLQETNIERTQFAVNQNVGSGEPAFVSRNNQILNSTANNDRYGENHMRTPHLPHHTHIAQVNQNMQMDNQMDQAVSQVRHVQGNPGPILPTVDDEFFHLTCRIEVSMKQKIERGEYVELEKLLPKDRSRKIVSDDRLELVNRDGNTFFVPASSRESGITNVRKWEQAFRIYAAIYSRANPHRAAEIWQYIFVINSAASSFSWENVAYYDFTFRQLMATYPERSWSIIYIQMWNLAMRDSLPSGGSGGRNNGHNNTGHQDRSFGNKGSRSDYCWRFNKTKCKFGSKCRYEHKCYYCDGFGHGINICSRKNKKENRGNDRQNHFDKNRDLGNQNPPQTFSQGKPAPPEAKP